MAFDDFTEIFSVSLIFIFCCFYFHFFLNNSNFYYNNSIISIILRNNVYYCFKIMVKRIDPRECQDSIKEVNDFHYLETINITPFTSKSIKISAC